MFYFIFLKKYIELICDVNDIINGKYDVDNFNEKLLGLLKGYEKSLKTIEEWLNNKNEKIFK
jgi:hypothetical protein